MRRAIKILLYPNQEQQDSLNFQFGAVRWIYNDSLAHRKDVWETAKKTVSKSDQHKQSRRLVDENQAICLETLKVRNMMKNKRLSKSIADAAWHSFTSKLVYKADWAGKHVFFIDQFHPSTKTCSACGVVHRSMTLNIRSWACDECDAHHDRDENAALNILRQGVHELRSAGIAVLGFSQTPVETM